MAYSFRQKVMNRIDHSLRKVGLALDRDSLPRVLKRLPEMGVQVVSIIDVGASNGFWSKTVMKVFPHAHYLLVEANEVHRQALENFCKNHKHTDFELVAASNKQGEVYFDGRDPFGGLASLKENGRSDRMVSCSSMDDLAEKYGLKGPFALKLDVHGFELPIFEGASKVLEETSLLVVESYNFQQADGLLFHEMVSWLGKKGFRPATFCDPTYRPVDSAFWQFDLFFLPKSSPVFATESWQ